MRARQLLTVAAAAALALSGCATEPIGDDPNGTGALPEPFSRTVSPTATTTEADAAPEPVDPQLEFAGSITASDQTGEGNSVKVERAEVEGVDGWIVVHEDADGQPGEVLGTYPVTSDLETKVVEDVEVALDGSLDAGEHTLWLMLHEDNGVVGTYEFPGPDQPIVDDGEIVMVSVTLTVE